MAWSDAARRAAALARRLRSNLQSLGRKQSSEGRRAFFTKIRAEAGMDRIVQSGGRIPLNDPLMTRRRGALVKIAKLQRKADKRGRMIDLLTTPRRIR